MESLVIIPARGGSKGIPHKNIKILGEKPLICHSIDIARKLVPECNICVTTDDHEIIKVVEIYGLQVPFVRPDYLATDTMGTYDVLLHALKFYEDRGKRYDNIILLQCTSPFRRAEDVEGALKLYTPEIDMVVSVKETSANPYYNCFEEGPDGFLSISKGNGCYHRRQDAPKAWEYNGAIYIINPSSLKEKPMSSFTKVVKYVMDDIHSIDLDTMFDWKLAELVLKEKMV